MTTGRGQFSPLKSRNPLETESGKKALASFEKQCSEAIQSYLFVSHQTTDELRYTAERFRRRHGGQNSSAVQFDLDPKTGNIVAKIQDELNGDLELTLSAEELEKVLMSLEDTEDNESTLTSFFIDHPV